MKKIILVLLVTIYSNSSFSNGYNTLQLERTNRPWNGVLFHLTSEWGYGPIISNIKSSNIVQIDDNAILHDLPNNTTQAELINGNATLIDIKNGRKLEPSEIVLCFIGKKCNHLKNKKNHEWPIVFPNYPYEVYNFFTVIKSSKSSTSTILLIEGNLVKLVPLNLTTVENYLPFKNGIINGKTYKNKAAFDINSDNIPDIVIAQTSPEYTYNYVLVNDNGKWKIAWQSTID